MRGRDKLLEEIDGLPVLRRQAIAALGTGCPVLVTLPVESARAEVLFELPLRVLEVTDAEKGISSSLRDGAGHLKDGQAIVILLPDVPGICTEDIVKVIAQFDRLGAKSVVRGGMKGEDVPGTPVVMPHPVATRLIKASGDALRQTVLVDQPVHLVRFEDDRAVRDLDTPEDWEKWRNEHRVNKR